MRYQERPTATYDVAFIPDGKTVVSTHRDGTLKRWDVATGEEQGSIGEYAPPLAFSRGSNQVAVANARGTVRWWDIAGGRGFERAVRQRLRLRLPGVRVVQDA